MAFRRTRIVGDPEDPTRQRVKKPALQGPAVEPVHADPHALQPGQEISPAGVQSLQRTIGNRAVSEMIVQRGMPPEEEEEARTAPTTLPPAGPGPIPTPYPNQTDVGSAKSATKKVKVASKKAMLPSAPTMRGPGEESGTMKGLISQTTPPFKTKTPEEDEQ